MDLMKIPGQQEVFSIHSFLIQGDLNHEISVPLWELVMIPRICIRLHFLTINSVIIFFIKTLEWQLYMRYITCYIIIGRRRDIYSFISIFYFRKFLYFCTCMDVIDFPRVRLRNDTFINILTTWFFILIRVDRNVNVTFPYVITGRNWTGIYMIILEKCF